MKHILLVLMVVVLAGLGRVQARAAGEQALPPGFDPARHMRVSEVRAGMQGYGLSVFKGTQIERFDVEVISVLRNFNPRHDVVLVRCKGANLEHTGSIAGMSGSPIFLVDDQGRPRMIGAFAYGWPLMKDPVGGVQPIEYMLAIPARNGEQADAGLSAPQAGQGPRAGMVWQVPLEARLPAPDEPGGQDHGTTVSPRVGGAAADAMRLRPLATPLMAAGLSPQLMGTLGPAFESLGLVPVQAGAAASLARDNIDPAVKIEPGAAMAVPLLTGDVELTAIGTVTEVLGDRVLGFGHPFRSEGPVTLPMGSGYIHTVIANLTTSFKIGSLVRPEGSIRADEMAGIAGFLGAAPSMVPLEVRIKYEDGGRDQVYRFQAASHPRFTPLLVAAAINAAASGDHELPQYHTLDYSVDLEFANDRSLRIENRLVNGTPMDLFREIGLPVMAAAENPFQRVMLRKLSATVRVTPRANEAQVLSVQVPRTKYQPGEVVKLFVTCRPFRGEETILPVEFELPRDLADGSYQFHVGDWEDYLREQQQTTPFRFEAENVADVFAVLQDISQVRHDALYLRLLREEDGVAIGRTAMPSLPGSRRQVLMQSGASNTTAFVSATSRTVPAPYVMSGSAEFEIVIDKQLKVETAHRGGQPARPEGAAEPADKPEDARKTATPAKPAAEPAAPAVKAEGEPRP